MGIIEIEGMEFYSYHGHYEEERIIGNRFILNITIETDTTRSEKSDQISHTINYQEIYQLIEQEMKKKSHLLEHIAGRIMDKIYMKFPEIIKMTLKVSKMNPKMGGIVDKVGVILTR